MPLSLSIELTWFFLEGCKPGQLDQPEPAFPVTPALLRWRMRLHLAAFIICGCIFSHFCKTGGRSKFRAFHSEISGRRQYFCGMYFQPLLELSCSHFTLFTPHPSFKAHFFLLFLLEPFWKYYSDLRLSCCPRRVETHGWKGPKRPSSLKQFPVLGSVPTSCPACA